jgi:hypothetical protein
MSRRKSQPPPNPVPADRDNPAAPAEPNLPGPLPPEQTGQLTTPAAGPEEHPVTVATLLDKLRFDKVCQAPGLVQEMQKTPGGYRTWRRLNEANVAVCMAEAAGPTLGHVRRLVAERWGDYGPAPLGHLVNWLTTERGLTSNQAEALPLAVLLDHLREVRSNGPAAFVPTPADLTILTVLDGAGGRALKQDEIIREANKLTRGAGRRPGLVPVSDTLLRERLPLLIDGGYVARPANPGGKPAARKGVGITDAGRRLLRAACGT